MGVRPIQKSKEQGTPTKKTHRLVRFETGAGCRDAKSSKKSQISNSFRQLIYQPASHVASHSILTIYSCVSWLLEKENISRKLMSLSFCFIRFIPVSHDDGCFCGFLYAWANFSGLSIWACSIGVRIAVIS